MSIYNLNDSKSTGTNEVLFSFPNTKPVFAKNVSLKTLGKYLLEKEGNGLVSVFNEMENGVKTFFHFNSANRIEIKNSKTSQSVSGGR